MRTLLRICLCSTLGLVALPADGQFPQYVRPGTYADSQPSTQGKLEAGYASARWSFGALRVDPVLAVRDVAYVSNVFSASTDEEEVSDFTASLTAGLFGYLHLGPDVILSGYVRPEAVWWRELDELRRENLNLGLGVFGFFNRLRVSADVERSETQRPLNLETEVPIDQRVDSAELAVELELRRRLFLFALAGTREFRFEAANVDQLSALAVSTLDRDVEIARGGVRFALTELFDLSLGVESSDAEFLVDPEGRSNSGSSPFASIALRGNRVDADLTVVNRELDFAEGSQLDSLEGRTGEGRVSFTLSDRSTVTGYGTRSLTYSAASSDSLFVTQRAGLSYSWQFGRRLHLRLFGEQGENDYSADGAQDVDRRDDFEAVGASLEVPLFRKLALVVGVTQFDLTSSLPGLDRSTTSVQTAIELTQELSPW